MFAGCKDRKKDAIFTTDDVNPNVRGNLFFMGEKGYSVKIPRLQWIVVKNQNKDVDLTLQNRSFPATLEVFGERTFKKNISLERAASHGIERVLKKEYKILEKQKIDFNGINGLEMKASGEVKLREYKTNVPRIVTCSVFHINKFTYKFTLYSKPEEFEDCYPEYTMVLQNFKFEEVKSKGLIDIFNSDFE